MKVGLSFPLLVKSVGDQHWEFRHPNIGTEIHSNSPGTQIVGDQHWEWKSNMGFRHPNIGKGIFSIW